MDAIHDHIVQSRGALDETVLGILRLKEKGNRVEVRIVLHRLTAPRLVETCKWLTRNLPFIDHVALMGLENTGFALANQDLLWIDPIDYSADLEKGTDILSSAGLKVSVYNLPLCLLDRKTWPFAVQSISDWKNAYLPMCSTCGVRDRCAGFFRLAGCEKVADCNRCLLTQNDTRSLTVLFRVKDHTDTNYPTTYACNICDLRRGWHRTAGGGRPSGLEL